MLRYFQKAFVMGFGFAAGVLALWATVLLAQSLNAFVSGNVVSAAELNANFSILDGRLSILDTNLSSLTTTTTTQGTRLTTAESEIMKIAPIGTILAWHKNLPGVPALPAGWVECNGLPLVDPASPLNGQTIPNLNGQGRFLRGSGASGTFQSDAFQGHRHYRNTINQPEHNMIMGFNSGGSGTFLAGSFAPVDQLTTGNPVSDGANGTPRIAAETRPTNMSVVWIMRVR